MVNKTVACTFISHVGVMGGGGGLGFGVTGGGFPTGGGGLAAGGGDGLAAGDGDGLHGGTFEGSPSGYQCRQLCDTSSGTRRRIQLPERMYWLTWHTCKTRSARCCPLCRWRWLHWL